MNKSLQKTGSLLPEEGNMLHTKALIVASLLAVLAVGATGCSLTSAQIEPRADEVLREMGATLANAACARPVPVVAVSSG